jgi:5-methylcytosine-specific restriction endonuclease McrA
MERRPASELHDLWGGSASDHPSVSPSTGEAVKRTPLRRRGKGAHKWEQTRRDYLRRRYDSLASMVPFNTRYVNCAAAGCPTSLWIAMDAGSLRTDGHLHHIVARSRAPHLIHDHANLALVCGRCHAKYELDKGGEKWRGFMPPGGAGRDA